MSESNRMPPPPPAAKPEAKKEAAPVVKPAGTSRLAQNIVRDIAPEPEAPPAPIPQSKLGGIRVVAIRDGFIQNQRKKVGDQFTVASVDKLGSWMKCLDPHAERAHQKTLKERREKLKKARVE